jgi:hypothetical protein
MRRDDWTWALLLAGAIVLGVAGCHDLELTQLRCSVGGRCPSGYTCGGDNLCRRQSSDGSGRVAGPPGSKKQGEACGAADECESKSCADGVCCDSACTDACHTCNHPDNVGTCVAVARGEAPAHAGCAKQPASSCGTNGLCDGAGACQLYDDTTVCGEASCDKASNSLSPQARCDGHGACAAGGGAIACAPFACRGDGKACGDQCSGDNQCVGANACTNGSCGLIGNGLPCHGAGQCQSGFCVDGVCCNAPCTEQCMACDTSAAPGTCSPVAGGNPHGGRPACAGGGTSCAGQCTAASATSCTYPAAETVCRSASCTNGASSATQTAAASCDGRGACGAAVTSACGVYMCGSGGVCATSCVGDFDCAAGYVCQGGACQAKGAPAAPCSTSGQCATGLVCVDGVCCESACADACHSCNLPGQAGHCVVVASADDPDSCPGDTRTCDAGGACKLKDGQSCMGGDCAVGACTTFYPDADGDTFGDQSATTANGKAKGLCGGAPAGFVANNGDCCDGSKDVHPGQTGWFTVAGPCGSFDYDCDGAATAQYPAMGACTDAIACTPGFVAATACGVSGNWQACDSSLPAVCAAPTPMPQPCH